jgi:sigma-E factor negative regulatory protein RseB
MSLLRAVRFLFILWPVLWPVFAVADEAEARRWLERLAAAGNEFAYRGVLVFERGDHIESLRITHGFVDGRPYDHLEYLDGDRREVIRSGSSLVCVDPGQRLSRLLRKQQRSAVAALEDHYALRLGGEGRIAGRDAVLLEAVQRDGFRFGYRFALDRATGLPLRYELVDDQGRVLERFQFTSLEFSDDLRPEWRRAVGDESPASPASAAGALPAVWQAGWLPPGFVAISNENDGEGQTYTDGLAIFSVFVEELAAADTGGSARQGATVAHTAPLRHGDRSYLVTVIGEIPSITAQRVADAVAWRESAP